MIVLLILGLNVVLCIFFGLYSQTAEYASNHLLLMFMANLFLYILYYVTMKFYTGNINTTNTTLTFDHIPDRRAADAVLLAVLAGRHRHCLPLALLLHVY